jgi:hypothetical protein
MPLGKSKDILNMTRRDINRRIIVIGGIIIGLTYGSLSGG